MVEAPESNKVSTSLSSLTSMLGLGSWVDSLVKALERIGSLALIAYVLIGWLPAMQDKVNQVAANQTAQTQALERLSQSVDRLAERIKP